MMAFPTHILKKGWILYYCIFIFILTRIKIRKYKILENRYTDSKNRKAIMEHIIQA